MEKNFDGYSCSENYKDRRIIINSLVGNNKEKYRNGSGQANTHRSLDRYNSFKHFILFIWLPFFPIITLTIMGMATFRGNNIFAHLQGFPTITFYQNILLPIVKGNFQFNYFQWLVFCLVIAFCVWYIWLLTAAIFIVDKYPKVAYVVSSIIAVILLSLPIILPSLVYQAQAGVLNILQWLVLSIPLVIIGVPLLLIILKIVFHPLL